MAFRRDARALICLTGVLFSAAAAVSADIDWPLKVMPSALGQNQELAAQLHLQWVRELPPLKAAWPDQPRMQFDAVYRPVALGDILFFGSSRTDSLLALDASTGEERWQFYTDGPVRLQPAVWNDK